MSKRYREGDQFMGAAEFLSQPRGKASTALQTGFARMGKPIGYGPRAAAYEHCKAMGIADKATAMQCVDQMAEQLERDQPYEAMNAGMRYLDLTGTYRLLAVLLTTADEEKPNAAT